MRKIHKRMKNVGLTFWAFKARFTLWGENTNESCRIDNEHVKKTGFFVAIVIDILEKSITAEMFCHFFCDCKSN